MRQFSSFLPARFALRAATALALVLGLAFVFLPQAQAQAQYGTITGTVTDPSGAVVPDAKIALTNQATTETRAASTDAAGLFSFTGVPQGTYSLTVTHHGFKTLHKSNVIVSAGAQIGIPGLKLALGAASQTVEVSGQAYYVVPTTSGAKEMTITNQQVENMPLEGRSVVQSVLILPGVVKNGFNPEVTGFNGTAGGVGGFNVNGGRGDAVSLTNNGSINIDPGNLGGAAVIPDKEMVSEVTVQTSNYSAANPQGPVVINTVTKAGTSQFHGEAYWTGRRPGWNSNDWLNNQAGLARPESTFNYPGFNIGGPIIIPGTSFNQHRNKAFFFFGAEWMRQTQDLGVHDGSVPTQDMRQGNFTELLNGSPYQQFWTSGFTGGEATTAPCTSSVTTSPFYEASADSSQNIPTYTFGNGATVTCQTPGIIPFGPAGSPTAMDPGGAAFMKQLVDEEPNHTPTAALPYNYISDATGPVNHNTYTGRIDYDFTENTKLYVTLDHESEIAVDPYGLWWGGSTIPYPGTETASQHSNQMTGTLVQVLSPTLTNEITFGTTRLILPWDLADPSLDSTSALGYPYGGVFANPTGLMPSLEAYQNALPTLINGAGDTVPTTYADKWLNNIRDDFSLDAGNHLLKFGAFFEHITNQQPSGDPRPTLQYSVWGAQSQNAYTDLELGNITSFSQSSAFLTPVLAYNELDGYIEDTWHTSSRLTLTIGLRLDHIGQPFDSKGEITAFSEPAYVSGGGYLCRNPGEFGCAASTAPSNYTFTVNGTTYTMTGSPTAYTGGSSAVGAYPGLLRTAEDPGVPLSAVPTPAMEFAPNFGFAYDLTGQAKTILRGGAGVFYYENEFNVPNGAVSNPPVASTVSLGGSGLYLSKLNSSFLPNCDTASAISNNACITGISALAGNNDRMPYTVSYSLTLSQLLPLRTVLEASYVGNVSRNQMFPGGSGNGGYDYNLIPIGTETPMWKASCAAQGYTLMNCTTPTEPSQLNGDQPFRPYADYGNINYFAPELYQTYNAFQLTATRTTPHVDYSIAYTFSKAMGISGVYNGGGFPIDPFDLANSYGPLPYDVTNALSAQYNIVLPNFGQMLFGRHLVSSEALDGWQITGITSLQQGFPLVNADQNAAAGTSITITGASVCGTNGASACPGNYNANFITGTPDDQVHSFVTCNPTANLGPNQVFNASCFESPGPGENGDFQIPYIHGPGFVNTDLGLFKSFGIGKSEVRKLQVRVEAFNVFNHPQGILAVNGAETSSLEVPYAGYMQSPALGSSNSAVNAGNIPGYLHSWTGHREMQLSLKFIF
ncbi:MAG: carboxypeptidase regulatory-like domain-containing protein [Terriglobales bacterium]